MESWDEAYESGHFKQHWDYSHPSQELVATVAAFGVPPLGVALDAGCGAGREAIFLARCGFRAVGVDISDAALTIARHRAREEEVDVSWLRSSVLEIPISDSTVDFVNDRGCFHHIEEEDRPAYAREMSRILKPGGRMLLRGCREIQEEIFVPVTRETIDRHFDADFSVGPVLPIELVSDAKGTLPANLVILVREP